MSMKQSNGTKRTAAIKKFKREGATHDQIKSYLHGWDQWDNRGTAMVVLIYEHDKRRILIEQNGKRREISTKRAQKYFDDDEISDHNVAFHRLILCDFDMEKVEQQYKGESK